MNGVRTLVVAHTLAALAGFGTYLLFGPQDLAAGAAMFITRLHGRA